ncbi:MAG: hypothetical protein JXR21_05835 [Candidatus Marinimicrobia bacterium]|nr:hypothetical protein [Candidatus Neomarinimicrobiota bacterium]
MMKIGRHKMKSLLRNILLGFVLISIGFLLGKYYVKGQNGPAGRPASGKYVAVYYMHSTFRCETCNRIEAMTKNLLDREYSAFLNEGSMLWDEIDFMKNTALAEQFEIAASCVVVADIRDGSVLRYRRLDEVWTLTADPPVFDAYLRRVIDDYLKGAPTHE